MKKRKGEEGKMEKKELSREENKTGLSVPNLEQPLEFFLLS